MSEGDYLSTKAALDDLRTVEALGVLSSTPRNTATSPTHRDCTLKLYGNFTAITGSGYAPTTLDSQGSGYSLPTTPSWHVFQTDSLTAGGSGNGTSVGDISSPTTPPANWPADPTGTPSGSGSVSSTAGFNLTNNAHAYAVWSFSYT